MKITALEAFGVDSRILKLWEDAGHAELLPIQIQAVQKANVLTGGNAVVFSPTSSGKTFVGEMAALRTARQNRRVLFLVPQKALAEEKFNEFRSRYGALGVRVVISTRDRKENDRDIRRGRFHIAVIVFEKMHALMVNSPAIIRNVGLVVVDELQMLGDQTRGPALEILLTKVLLAEHKPQIICLSAVLGNAKGLASWLGATLCEDRRRPVELRRGVLYQGVFSYREHNGKAEGSETLGRVNHDPDWQAILVGQVKALTQLDEQSIVFCKSRKECMETARAIAAALDVAPARGTLAELNDLEDSEGKDYLTRLLERRVAYHNADLDWHQRDIIERGFRRGEIAVICATTTLAMGMNFPARNVFIDPERWDRDRAGRWITIPIAQAEYENISGRAGRLGLEQSFGRAILIAESEFDQDRLFTTYVQGELGDLEPALASVTLSQHVLNLVASRLCRSEAEIGEMLLASYTGSMHWRGDGREEEFAEKLRAAVEHCIEGGLIVRGKKGLEPTEIGKLAATKGVTVDTAIGMSDFLRERSSAAADISPFEVIWHLSATEDGQRVHFHLSTQEWRSGEYASILNDTLGGLAPSARRRLRDEMDGFDAGYENTQRAKKALLLHDWTRGLPTRQIEARFHCFAGSIAGLGSEFSWLAETLAGMAKLVGWPDGAIKLLESLSGQLVHGVQSDGLPLAAIRVRGFSRGRIMALVAKGWNTLEKLLAASIDELRKLVTGRVADHLHTQAARLLEREVAEAPQADTPVEINPKVEDETHEIAWDDSYPPADDIGARYLCSATIRLDGQADKKRHLVHVNDQQIWLAPQSFETALKLAIRAKASELGWLPVHLICADGNHHQVIRRLRQDLEPTGLDMNKLVENGSKAYRFSVPPDSISWNDSRIHAHAPELAHLLDEASESA
ncbi:MAG: DEAD/DEAH box helicase [Phycisphaerae bacterium]|nr:DEAD/DEAH box helicase [Phycisphaerae bacterium]